MCHGRDDALAAAETARATFEDGAQGAALPTIDIPGDQLAAGIPAFQLLVQSGLAKSNGDARRLIRGGGGRVNDVVIGDETQVIDAGDINAEGVVKLSAGRKNHALIQPR